MEKLKSQNQLHIAHNRKLQTLNISKIILQYLPDIRKILRQHTPTLIQYDPLLLNIWLVDITYNFQQLFPVS